MGATDVDNNECCNVCGKCSMVELFRSCASDAITSLGRLVPGSANVSWCNACGHVQTAPLGDLETYYASEYKILAASEEEDQIYEVRDGETVFRFDHQLRTLLAKIDIPRGAKVLDYGCAKSATLRKLLDLRPDIRPHFFDVSNDYLDHWKKMAPPESWATMKIKPEWRGRFELITSFFSLEHVKAVQKTLLEIGSLLRPGGTFYMIVPNFVTNVADFIVVDHINHFTHSSLLYGLSAAGLVVKEVDSEAHRGAWVITATRDSNLSSEVEPSVNVSVAEGQRIAGYWAGISDRIAQAQTKLPSDTKSAIYGAGFYGTYIGTILPEPDSVECFVDQNPFLQGATLLGKPILPPEQLPLPVSHIYVGLNPAIAREVMKSINPWKKRTLEYTFL